MTDREKKRILALLPLLLSFAGVLILSVYLLCAYRQATFFHISKFCEVMIEGNPQVETEVLSAVKEYHTLAENEIEGNVFLKQYGYKYQGFGKELGWRVFSVSLVWFLLSAGCFLFSAGYVDRRNRGRIAELTSYLEQINIGVGGTIIQTKEDEFSHLQDEMYKTVTELYQTREAAVAAKTNFADNLANIAHQLKTPITAAFLSLQLMEKETPNLYAKQIQKQLERLNRLEESLLTISKIDAGTLPFEHAPVDVYTVLCLAAENLSDLLHKKNVSVAVPDKGCVEIWGDMEWTMEALMNLIKNCMEHSPENGVVYCDYSSNPLYAQIRIWDEGDGFEPSDLPRLFERFYRGKNAVDGGMGIGLALAKSILEMENASLTAHNLPDGGGCFEIRVYRH